MKKLSIILIAISSLLFCKNNYPNMSFFAGTYDLLGKKINSTKTYYGKAKIEIIKKTFKMTRVIENKTNIIYGKFDTNSYLELSFLIFHFKENKINYVLSYQWHSDYNNYPILSGSFSIKNKRSDEFGLEFLISDI